MITEARRRSLKHFGLGTAAALLFWLSGLLLLPRLVELPVPLTIVAADSRTAVEVLHRAGLPLLWSGGRAAVTPAAGPDAVARLYQSGAWLVLPATAGGCRGSATDRKAQPAALRQAS